jgi:hypothetical protein
MPNTVPATATPVQPPARTHAQASQLFRRPFAPGAIGFRAMTKVALNGQAYAGAQIAAFLNAQSVVQRLNAVAPGRWRQEFQLLPTELIPQGSKKTYLVCRLIITLPITHDGRDVEAVYADVGEMDNGSLAGLKALYSDARKRAGVLAGIGAYLYTALAPVVLPIGPRVGQVQAIRRSGKSDLLILTPETEQWLRQGYQARVNTPAVRRDLGEILPHGEPETGMGQGDAAEQTATADSAVAEHTTAGHHDSAAPDPTRSPNTTALANRNGGGVAVDFAQLGPRDDTPDQP